MKRSEAIFHLYNIIDTFDDLDSYTKAAKILNFVEEELGMLSPPSVINELGNKIIYKWEEE